MKPKIALFGGTFDPIHQGHIDVANKIKKIFKIDEIIFVPAYRPPHKDEKFISEYNHRFNMVVSAVVNMDGFSVSRVEEVLGSKNTYTVDVINKIKVEKNEADLYFILGSDSLFDIEVWKSFQEIFKNVTIICYSREIENEELTTHIDRLTKEFGARIILVEDTLIDISSTIIRNILKNSNDSVRNLLPKNVIKYIEQYKLYR